MPSIHPCLALSCLILPHKVQPSVHRLMCGANRWGITSLLTLRADSAPGLKKKKKHFPPLVEQSMDLCNPISEEGEGGGILGGVRCGDCQVRANEVQRGNCKRCASVGLPEGDNHSELARVITDTLMSMRPQQTRWKRKKNM